MWYGEAIQAEAPEKADSICQLSWTHFLDEFAGATSEPIASISISPGTSASMQSAVQQGDNRLTPTKLRGVWQDARAAPE